jgi:pimeloyl-ACP methyl ester carboxylesterase
MYEEAIATARAEGLDAAKRAAERKARPPIFLATEAGQATFERGWESKFGMGVDRYCVALESAARSDLPDPDLLRTLELPVLILAWRSDVQHPLQTAEMLAETLPNAELHVAKSWAEIEQFPERIESFIQKLIDAEDFRTDIIKERVNAWYW